MGRYVEKKSSLFTPNYTENTQDSNTSRFTCRCIYTTPGTYTFTVPSGVTSITAVAVGPGGCANTIAKLKEQYVYKMYQNLYTQRYQCRRCPCTPGASGSTSNDPYGTICLCTYSSSSFRLGGYSVCGEAGCSGASKTCYRSNFDTVYSKIDYAVFDSAPGGGYSEKEITTTPGSTFTVVVGVNTGNNFSCVNGQICATGPCIVNGSGISTETQYVCSCTSESFNCCGDNICYRCESYSLGGCYCYIKEKVSNSCIVSGCGFGGTINRTGGLGCRTLSYLFPLGFDQLTCDQNCNVTIDTTCNQFASPFLCIARCIVIGSCIASYPTTASINECARFCDCPSCHFPQCRCCECFRACMANVFTYCDTICKVNVTSADSTNCWCPRSNFLIPNCYCGVCFGSCCSNFIGIVTAVNINNISVTCSTSGGSSSGSPCFNGVYQPSSGISTLTTSTTDTPGITTFFGGRPVFTTWCGQVNCSPVCNCLSLLDYKVYTGYDPIGIASDIVTLIANSGCNPCNCRDIGCFYCTCRFDIIKNMWGIVSGPCCFAFGATGIGNSLALCDPLRWNRSVGCHCYSYCVPGVTFYSGCCANQCAGAISHYGSSYGSLIALWNNYYSQCLSCNVTLLCEDPSTTQAWGQCLSILRCNGGGGACDWACTNYYPTTTCYSSFSGTCLSTIPVMNLYELFCDSAGKCTNFCCTFTDAGKQFQVHLGELGLDTLRAHFSPCVCSAKCFSSYNNWPCYFASTGVGTTIACGGNSPLVPRQEMTVCDPRWLANNFHCIQVNICYSFGRKCGWLGTSYDSACVYCNTFAAGQSTLCRGYKVGDTYEAGAGIAYTGAARTLTCCYAYAVAASAPGAGGSLNNCCVPETIAVVENGGGGGTYSSIIPTKIYKIGRCSSVILAPSGGKGWGDYDQVLSENNGYNAPKSKPTFDTWFDVRQAKGSGARGPICIDGYAYCPVKAGPGGGGIGGYGNEYASTCVFGGAVCAGTAGPGGGAGGQGTPGTGMVVIYWNP